MMLEDFFTLTEMKDGLTSPARVKQLVDVLQKEKHNIVNNVGEVTRQWSTVASAIAATENKDCLELFLQSDGLGYFDSWLKDAQNFGNERGDSFVEEPINALLGAIEKLHMGDQQLDSRIFFTVKKLCSHNSFRVQERAKTLYDSWKQNSESKNVVLQDNEKIETVCEDQPNASANPVSECEHLEGLSSGISPPEDNTKGGDDDEKNVDTARNEMILTMCSETVQPKEVEDQNIQASDIILDHALVQNGAPDPECSSGMLNLVSENHSTLETAAQTQQTEVTMGTGGSEVSKQGIVEEPLDFANSSECDLTKQTQQIRISDKLDAMDASFSVESTNTLDSKVDPDVVKDVEEAHPEVFPPGDLKPDVPVGIVVTGDKNSQSPCRDILVSDDTGKIKDCSTDFLRNSYISDHKTGKSKNSFTYLSRIEESGVSEESSKHDDTDDDLGNESDVSTLAFNARMPDVIERSDIELDYGGFDPLEVARQVAIEVEREVDCREPSSSSSERVSGGVRRPGSPNSINRKKDRVIQDSFKDVQTGPSVPSAVGEDTIIVTTDNLISEQEACLPDMDASQVPVAAQTSEPNSDKGNCSFDLNDEVLPHDMDHQINSIATPVSVVSASRPAAASELPVAPLQFEGALGWKGSAETSAFRPAPPRKNSEASKPFFASGSNNSLQQRQYFDIDLNVAESEDDKIADLMLGKGVVTSVDPSIGEPSSLGPERSSRLELDLNCISDCGDVPSHWIKEGQVVAPRNGHQSPSHSSSSSSSSMQHSLRNFDLNDQPPPFSDFSDPVNFGKLSQNSYPSRGSRIDETVICIMGARVEVNRKEFFPQSFPVTNGRISNNAVDANSTRTGSLMELGSTFPFAHSNAYGHHSPSPGSNIPFSSAIYGHGSHIPYTMDSRESPVVPQIIGSALSALPTGFPQPPFIMNTTGEPSGSNGVVPFRHNFDLNSGVMFDGGRNTGGLRQFFNSGQGISIDDHMRPNLQSTSSSDVGGKRKETDGGWEHYPFNYKHHQGPWK